MSRRSRKWFLGLAVTGVVGLAGASASAGPAVWFNIPAQAAILKNPAKDQTAWWNTYGKMVHVYNLPTNELDFPIPMPSGGAPPGQLFYSINGNNNGTAPGAGSYCGQLLAMGSDGSLVTSPYVCAAAGQSSFSQTIALSNYVAYTAFAAVWVTGWADVDSVGYAYLNNPYVLAP